MLPGTLTKAENRKKGFLQDMPTTAHCTENVAQSPETGVLTRLQNNIYIDHDCRVSPPIPSVGHFKEPKMKISSGALVSSYR